MREFYTTIDEALLTGLKTEIRIPRNSPVLHECLGFRIGKRAIEGIESLSNPLPVALPMHYNWPFPQFLKQESWKILVVRDAVNMEDIVYSFDANYNATQIFAIDELTFGQGTLMELADFGEYAFMTNGVLMLYWDPTLGPAGDWDEKTSIPTIQMMRTICNFKGQMIGGCVLSAWHDCDEKFIVWSDIGSVDFTPTRRNEAGYRRDPYGGEIYHVRRLGDDVIVYSSTGITRMFPSQAHAATFGFSEIHNVGLKNRGAMNGDINQHLFVDLEDSVFKLNKEGLKELGYIGYVEELNAEDNIITFNPYKGDFYISDGVKSLLLSPNGMTNYPYEVSAVWYDDEDGHGLCGFPETPNPMTHEPIVVSHVIDMGYRGQKTIFSIELGASAMIDAEIAIDWRMSSIASFQRTAFAPVNNEGVATLIAAGTEFRICVKSKYFVRDTSELDYITLRWKMTDLRALRGIYAAPPRGQR